MPRLARCCLFLLPLLASPAIAQTNGAAPPPFYRIPAAPSRPAPAGVATMDVGAGLQFGVGRVRVFAPAQLLSHVEPEPHPMDVRRRERSIAAVRFSFSF